MKKNLLTSCFALLAFNSGALATDQYYYLDEKPETQSIVVRELYTDESIIRPLYQMTKDVSELLEKYGITYWASFGTLLGAERHKGVIPWDDDTDFCYDKADEYKLTSAQFLEEIKCLGYVITSDEFLGYKVKLATPIIEAKTQPDVEVFLDLFTTELQEGRYILSNKVARDTFPNGWYDQEQVQNRRKVDFGEFTLFAPADGPAFLTRNHGAEWSTVGHYYQAHHGAFKGKKYVWTLNGSDFDSAKPTGPLLNRVKDINSHVIGNKAYWDKFYATTNLGRTPSSFCSFILEQKDLLAEGSTLLDIGCGNGRDTFEFRNKGIRAYGLDGSQTAVDSNNEYAERLEIGSNIFRTVDVCNGEAMKEYQSANAIYARFFMHAISEAQQVVFKTYLASLNTGSKVLLEFRTDHDPMFLMSEKLSSNEGKTDHYRRFINFNSFCKELKILNYKITYTAESAGLSIGYKSDPIRGRITDDPVLGRIIAIKM
jgi:tellurite methyltransferase